MKVNKLSLVMLSALSLAAGSAMAADAPAQALLQWTGYVGGTFNSSTIGLTGQGGGEIQDGLLSVEDTGEFVSERAIVVEAHPLEADGVTLDKVNFYEGEVNWNISGVSVNNAAYDVANLAFQINGTDYVSGTPFSTSGSDNSVGVTVAYSDTPTGVNPGDAVQVAATILAEAVITAP